MRSRAPATQPAVAHPATPDPSNTDLASDLLWGVAAIAVEIGRPVKKTNRALAAGYLPARKCGLIWVGSRRELRAHLTGST